MMLSEELCATPMYGQFWIERKLPHEIVWIYHTQGGDELVSFKAVLPNTATKRGRHLFRKEFVEKYQLAHDFVNRAAELQAERDAYLFALTEYFMKCPPDYQEDCDMTDCASRTVDCWKRWASEQIKGENDAEC